MGYAYASGWVSFVSQCLYLLQGKCSSVLQPPKALLLAYPFLRYPLA